ncbi:alpha/beta hydrolase [Streptomyces sp. RTd22]|uniref:alpha/beta hydrolase n=1 Tax=Streptomyces sp. RTd22 TaxID=1841249 RepID=UPI0007C53272|nr:alpha/beta hydrolase [Streptomyces sp. RTd22]
MTLDPATSEFLARAAASGAPPLHELTPREARDRHTAMSTLFGAGPAMARVEEAVAPGGGHAGVPVRLLVPCDAPRGVILYLHGGGWVVGALDAFDTLGRRLARRTGCAVALADYRLAPEHPYPAAPADAWTALRWADAHRARVAGPDAPLIVAGDSAGGNLAAVVAQRAREAGGPAVAAQVLLCPVTDCRPDTASYHDPANQLLLTRATMAWYWDHYAPDTAARRDPGASPLRAADLTGLPPAVVVTAEHDVLRDEGEAYADRLRAAGVAVELRRFEGQIHGFVTLLDLLPDASAEALGYVADRLGHLLDLPRSHP